MNGESLPDRLYAAYNRHDPDAVAAVYAADAVHEEVAQGQVRSGAEAIAAGLRRFFGWFPDAHWARHLVIDDGRGRMAVSYLLTATLQERLGPFLPCGQPISLRGIHVLHLADGRIARSEDYWDAATFQRQLDTAKGGERTTS